MKEKIGLKNSIMPPHRQEVGTTLVKKGVDKGSLVGKDFSPLIKLTREKMRAKSEAVDKGLISARVEEQSDLMSEYTRQSLKEIDWEKIPYKRDSQQPSLTFYYSSKEKDNIHEVVEDISERVTIIADFLGYKKEELVDTEIFLDPTMHGYDGGVGAYFFIDDENEKTGLWIKQKTMHGLDHEITHYITLGDGKEYPETLPSLLSEGIAMWTSENVQSHMIKGSPRDADDDYHGTIASGVADLFVPREQVHLDFPFEGNASRVFGGILFDTIYDAFEQDAKAVGKAWRTAGKFTSVKEWIDSLGLSAQAVEEAWIKRLNYPNSKEKEFITW